MQTTGQTAEREPENVVASEESAFRAGACAIADFENLAAAVRQVLVHHGISECVAGIAGALNKMIGSQFPRIRRQLSLMPGWTSEHEAVFEHLEACLTAAKKAWGHAKS